MSSCCRAIYTVGVFGTGIMRLVSNTSKLRKRIGKDIMTKYLRNFSLLVVAGLASCGSSEKYEVFDPEDRVEVEAVYMHELQNFSVAVLVDNKLILRRIPFMVSIFVDADKTWYMCSGKRRRWDGVVRGSYCELHLSSVDYLNTAGWDHGKYGSGTTTRIN